MSAETPMLVEFTLRVTPTQIGRLMPAMMTMVKLDIEALVAAFGGEPA